MIVLGLTGSIGMGKSTVAKFFAEEAVPVYSADDTTHRLYKQPEVVNKIGKAFPNVVHDGEISRSDLAKALFADKTTAEQQQAVLKLEAIIHPLVRAEEQAFVQKNRDAGEGLVVVDIPLLLETMAKDTADYQDKSTVASKPPRIDYLLVVSAPYEIQRARVLARPQMTEAKFEAIVARQIDDKEKRAKADFILDTSKDPATTRAEVKTLINNLYKMAEN